MTKTERTMASSGLDRETSEYVEPIEQLKASMGHSEMREDARYAGSQAGSALGSSLGSMLSMALLSHRATAIVIGTTAGVSVGVALAMRVVPKTLGPVWAWTAVGGLVASGCIIAGSAMLNALRSTR